MSVLYAQVSTTGLVPNTSGLGLGLTQQSPSIIYLTTNDTLTNVLVTGYLNASRTDFQIAYNNYQMALVYTTDEGDVWLRVLVAGTNYSLESTSAAGTVALPTVANQIAYATNASGGLGAAGLTSTLFNLGNISAGKSGTAGIFTSYPSTALKGTFAIVAVANTGNTSTTLSNDAMGQGTSVYIPDPANAVGQLLIGATATPFTDGRLIKASGTAGLTLDAGFLASNVMLLNAVNTMAAASQIILDKGTGTEVSNAVTINKSAGVITTTSLTTAGGATETITLTNSEVATTSVVLATIGNAPAGNSATNAYTVTTSITAAHTVVFVISNLTAATALNGALVINFAVF